MSRAVRVDLGGSAELVESLPEMQRQLTAAVRRVCPPWLASQSDDLVQRAMIRVIEAMQRRGTDPELSGGYLWRVAYTAVIDEIRRHRRRREVSLAEDQDGLLQLPTAEPDPERRADARRTGEAIAGCLQRLAPDRRHAVTLHLLGHTVPEVARLLGWDAKRADNCVYRGLADLRRCLTDKGFRP